MDDSSRKRSLDKLCSQNPGDSNNSDDIHLGSNTEMIPETNVRLPPPSPDNESDDMKPPPKNRTRSSLLNNNNNASSIQKLRLEAIFHPKFENEQSDQAIRQNMIQRVSTNCGYLEVTLKHSGSLLLWSGNQRFYSKNSTDNVFTGVGEILLRQHFARAWDDNDNTEGNGNEHVNGIDDDKKHPCNNKFQECSEFVEKNFLTLSFEVVPSVLGHHGDIPNRDYMILIAVADRQRGTFYDTSELVSFAHKFRLPHNDSWVFTSKDSTEKLFTLYDTMRETGMASDVVGVLDGAADGGHVKSMYPHHIFQGEILEGIVIRYVPYNNPGQVTNVSNNHHHAEEGKERVLRKMRDLCTQSEEVLKLVPPEKSSISTGQASTEYHVNLMHTDLRVVYENEAAVSNAFEEKVQLLLDNSHGNQKRTIYRLNKRNSPHRVQDIDIPKMASDLLKSHNIDNETKRIAMLIQTLGSLNINVDYNLLREESKVVNGESVERYLCIIHVRHDSSFQKYNNATKMMDAMPLYRGFSIELVLEGQTPLHADHDMSDSNIEKALEEVRLESNDITKSTHVLEEEKLMLKMKFLPYMVRTFICRNGLAILTKSGVAGFEQYALSQLNRWNISSRGIEKWIPFFQGWALYCKSVPTKTSSGKFLPPLTSASYLHHYEEYSTLYESGQIQTPTVSDQPTFRGLLVLVGVRKEDLYSLANEMSIELRCHRVLRDINAMSEVDMISSIQRNRGGIICTASIVDGVKTVRSFAKKFQNAIYVIMVGCSKDEIETIFVQSEVAGSNRKEVLKTIGISNAWKKCKCNFVVEIPRIAISADVTQKGEKVVSAMLKKLKDSSNSFQTDTRPGMLLFFPAIPGSGKSSLCHQLTADALGIKSRKVLVREGDKTQGKFYPAFEKDILDAPSSIFVADKNVPPASWSSVSNICSNHKMTAVAVLPSATEDCKLEISHEDSTTVARSCVFPFTLHYLAVCMSRVLQRTTGSHNGKLDSATELACMVVIKFYCLYRDISNAKLLQNIHSMGKSHNVIIRVPFFRDGSLPELPEDLKQSLHKAINLQVLDDLNMLDVTHSAMKQMDEDLRTQLGLHANYLAGLTAAEDYSKQTFLKQFSKKVSSHSDKYEERSEKLLMTDFHGKDAQDTKEIKIVSLDTSQAEVRGILGELAKDHPTVEKFMAARVLDTTNDDDNKEIDRFIKTTHCTFAHWSQMSQTDMRSTFSHILGTQAKIIVTAFLYSEEIGALEVSIPSKTITDPTMSIPGPSNKFPHITVWCGKNIHAWQSNLLPKQVERNQATRVKLKKPIELEGSFSFWYSDL